MPMAPIVARKTVTHIQEGSVYKDRWTLEQVQPVGTTVRQVFYDSSGGDIAEIVGDLDGRIINFYTPYLEVQEVPNGAGFYTYIHRPDDGDDDEHLVRYGSTFRRQLTFPTSPANQASTIVRQYGSDFQQPPGNVGGLWRIPLGKVRIWPGTGGIDDTTIGNGNKLSNASSWFARFYVAMAFDSVEVGFSIIDKGGAQSRGFVPICSTTSGDSYLMAVFDNVADKLWLGYGDGPSGGTIASPSGHHIRKTDLISHTVPSDELERFVLRFSSVTKKLTLYNEDKSTVYCEWLDDDDEAIHGKGNRYIGLAGMTSAPGNNGHQFAYVNASVPV